MDKSDYNKTGGPAFPTGVGGNDGMTIRDYFAAAALTGLAKMSYNVTETALAKEAFELADAMLEVRRR